jgi:hypothetical protein
VTTAAPTENSRPQVPTTSGVSSRTTTLVSLPDSVPRCSAHRQTSAAATVLPNRPTAATSRSPDPSTRILGSPPDSVSCTSSTICRPSGICTLNRRECPRLVLTVRSTGHGRGTSLTINRVVRSPKMLRGHVEQSLPYAVAKFSRSCTRTIGLFLPRYRAYVPILSAFCVQPPICRQVGCVLAPYLGIPSEIG